MKRVRIDGRPLPAMTVGTVQLGMDYGIANESGKPDEKLLAECPYLYYYNFSKENQTGYERVNGTNWYYEARFWSGMPDLNLDSDAVFDEITKITKFWNDRGVDGFRLDAVTSYYTDNNEKNIEFMTKLKKNIVVFYNIWYNHHVVVGNLFS